MSIFFSAMVAIVLAAPPSHAMRLLLQRPNVLAPRPIGLGQSANWDLDGDGRNEFVYVERAGSTDSLIHVESLVGGSIWTYHPSLTTWCPECIPPGLSIDGVRFVDCDSTAGREAVIDWSAGRICGPGCTTGGPSVSVVSPTTGATLLSLYGSVVFIGDLNGDAYAELVVLITAGSQQDLQVWGFDGATSVLDQGPPPDTTAILPALTRLLPAFPNPSAGFARIPIQLERGATVTVEIYDLTGRVVRRVSPVSFQAGTHEFLWDGRGSDSRPVSAGSYFYRVLGTASDLRGRVILRR